MVEIVVRIAHKHKRTSQSLSRCVVVLVGLFLVYVYTKYDITVEIMWRVQYLRLGCLGNTS
jgi:hypothetical protein